MIKDIQIGKEEIKMSLFASDMRSPMKIPRNLCKSRTDK